MLAVSTSWITERTVAAQAIVDGVLDLGIAAVELDCRIDAATYQDLRRRLKKAGLRVVSVHNFFPVPELAKEPGGDAFLHTSDDDRERELALRYTLRTLEACATLEAQAVVLHLGCLPLHRQTEQLYQLYQQGALNGGEGDSAWQELRRARATLAPRYLDRALSALDRILQAAERLGVWVGIENRYHYHEVPSLEEIGTLLRQFRGAPLGYWHDTGHAHHWEIMGWARQEDFLEAYADHLLGLHLHDAKGREDHFAPGTGQIDFRLVARYLRDGALRVCEVHSKSDANAYKRGLELLRRLGF